MTLFQSFGPQSTPRRKTKTKNELITYKFDCCQLTFVSSSTTRNPSPEMCNTPFTGRRLEF